MRTLWMTTAAAIVLTGVGLTNAEELTSGVEVGGKIGAYSTTKLCGCDDGVKVGKSLCYT